MNILICEDSVLLREGLVRLLEDAEHSVVATFATTEGVLDAVAELTVDLALLDVRLPPTFTDEGVRVALELRKVQPDLPVVVLSQYVEERYAAELISGNRGHLAYLLKDRVQDVVEFVETIEHVAAGGTRLDPEVVTQLLSRSVRNDRIARMTSRERDVLGAMAEGRSNAAIAKELIISEGSVEKHISAVFAKLELDSSANDNRRVLAVLGYLGVQDAAKNGNENRP